MNEIEVLLATVRAAKASNVASLNALSAVEAMLTSPVAQDVAQEEAVPDVVPDVVPEGCLHERAMLVETMTGNYRLCECGEQIEE
jgi:hypothetical protein